MLAEQELEFFFDRLTSLLSSINDEHDSHFLSILKILDQIDPHIKDFSELQFHSSLVNLASAVIEFRNLTDNSYPDLPIPPYDLWLPFKAQNLYESSIPPAAFVIFNKKVNFIKETDEYKTKISSLNTSLDKNQTNSPKES